MNAHSQKRVDCAIRDTSHRGQSSALQLAPSAITVRSPAVSRSTPLPCLQKADRSENSKVTSICPPSTSVPFAWNVSFSSRPPSHRVSTNAVVERTMCGLASAQWSPTKAMIRAPPSIKRPHSTCSIGSTLVLQLDSRVETTNSVYNSIATAGDYFRLNALEFDLRLVGRRDDFRGSCATSAGPASSSKA